MAFKAIQPIAVKPLAEPKKATPAAEAPKLIIETPAPSPVATVREAPPVYQPAAKASPQKESTATAVKEVPAKGIQKLSSLDAIRQKIQADNCGSAIAADQPLQQETLEKAWQKFILVLREAKNPAVQSFELAQLIIKDAASFEATATNNIAQKFLEFERNKACAFLQKELCNKQLQVSILLIAAPEGDVPYERPLSTKEQYQKIVEEFPLVRELRERLRLDLDF